MTKAVALKKYLVALPCFSDSAGFNHRTILVKAKSIEDALSLARHLKPKDNLGDVKEVTY
jgi:hypothetical protein